MILIVLVVLAMALPAIGGPSAGEVDRPASASEPADRVVRRGMDVDVVSISNFRDLRDDVSADAIAAVATVGGSFAFGRSASLPMKRVTRGGEVVQSAGTGFAFPMGTTVLPTFAVAALMGVEAATALEDRGVVMSRLSASLRGAQAGDRIDVVAANGSVNTLPIVAVLPDEVTGGTELLISDDVADLLGVVETSRIVLWGFASRQVVERALDAAGLTSGTDIRVSRSWDPPNPDSTLGMAQTKAALGEFAYRVTGSGAVVLDAEWHDANISRSGPIGQLTLRSGCHVTVRRALQRAIDELIASGLEDTLNYRDANSAGGCFVPRFNRRTPDSSIGFLSRHTWGMAVDTNTVGSCQGCEPPDMDCRTVRIFRRHGFAWGGNFVRADGMHFEWVGEPRDHLMYPSRFCANITSVAQLSTSEGLSQRSTMFAGDGLVPEG